MMEEEKKSYPPEPAISEKHKRKVQLIKRKYNEGITYKQNRGFLTDWPEYDKFWEGDQWPQATKKTRKYPRPVTNHFAAIIEQKTSGITYEEPEIYFDPVGQGPIPRFKIFKMGEEGVQEKEIKTIDASEALSHVARREWHRLDMDDIVEDVSRSAGVIGTGIFFAPWDDSIIGGVKDSLYIGNVCVYEVDPADFIPGDPSLPTREMQYQPWIIMRERRTVEEVKEAYKDHASKRVIESIKPDTYDTSRTSIYKARRVEQGTDRYVTLIHYWYKTYDEVEEEEEGILERPAINLNYVVVANNYVIREQEYLYESGLYPFSGFSWYPRRGCFFGKPESKDLINNQKEENRLAGISLLSMYQTGVPNLRIKTEYINKHSIPDGPGGGIIEDDSPLGAWAVDFMNPPTPPGNIPQFRAGIVESMKDTSGVHEAWAGKAPGARLNASAILALQEAAGIRIRPIQKRLLRAIKDLGRIWLSHWKEFYKEDRLFRVVKEENIKGFMWFSSTSFQDLEFDITVRADAASPFNKSLISQQLDNLLDRHVITGEEYLENVPSSVFPLATRIIERRKEKMEEARIQQLEHQLVVTKQIVDSVINTAKDRGVPVDSNVIEELFTLLNQAEEEMQKAEEEQEEGGEIV